MPAVREKLHKMRQTDSYSWMQACGRSRGAATAGDAQNEFAGVFRKSCLSASRMAESMAACGSGRNRWPGASHSAPCCDREQA
jgi:hypothetical protein